MPASQPRRTSRADGPVQSVARALGLLDALQREESIDITELSRLHGVHRSTTLRLLQTLERFGYVTRGHGRGEFRLGLRLYELGLAASYQNDLLGAARPIMRDLAATTGETIDLTLCDGGEMVLLESVSVRPFARVGIEVGGRVACAGTTAGKLRLAALSSTAVEQELLKYGLPRTGPKTITDVRAYLEMLAEVRRVGYAVNDEETDAGVRFVGVRITPTHGWADLVLVMGAPTGRLPRESYQRVAALLRAAAKQIAATVA
jgi:DNA-binding IclR family transcriptional regulator